MKLTIKSGLWLVIRECVGEEEGRRKRGNDHEPSVLYTDRALSWCPTWEIAAEEMCRSWDEHSDIARMALA